MSSVSWEHTVGASSPRWEVGLQIRADILEELRLCRLKFKEREGVSQAKDIGGCRKQEEKEERK